jgi:hypothetical protein
VTAFVTDFKVNEAEVRKRIEEAYRSEQAFRSQPSMRAKFYRHEDGEVWFTAEHLGAVGGLREGGDTLNTPATDAHRANYPAEHKAFMDAEAAAAPARK